MNAEVVRRVLATHVLERPMVLAISRTQIQDVSGPWSLFASRGFYVQCSCGYTTDPGPRPGNGVTNDGSRLRALVLGRAHLAAEIAKVLQS